jgi:hypothetical protein
MRQPSRPAALAALAALARDFQSFRTCISCDIGRNDIEKEVSLLALSTTTAVKTVINHYTDVTQRKFRNIAAIDQ